MLLVIVQATLCLGGATGPTCPWGLTSKPYEMLCADGHRCTSVNDGWYCCNCHGGPIMCSHTDPFMCLGELDCTGSGPDGVCCQDAACKNYRPCPHTFKQPADACSPPSPPATPPPSPSEPVPPAPPQPPQPPPAPPAPPSPPQQPPGQRLVASVPELRAAIDDASTARIVLAAAGSPYILSDGPLRVARALVLTAEVWEASTGQRITLDAAASESDQRPVVEVLSNATVRLEALRITGGFTQRKGGAINSLGKLTVSGCVIENNTGVAGGAIFNNGIHLEVVDSVLRNNSVTLAGGALWSAPTSRLDVVNTTITGNYAGDEGGGIISHSMAFITKSRIVENRAANRAGGVANTAEAPEVFGGGVMTLRDCEISHNHAQVIGGGLGNTRPGSRLILINSSVMANIAPKVRHGVALDPISHGVRPPCSH